MPQIPSITSKVNAASLASSDRLPRSQDGGRPARDGLAYTAQAVGAVAQAAGDIASSLKDLNEYKSKATVANSLAQFDPVPDILDVRKNAPADGTGIYDETKARMTQRVTDHVNAIDDPRARELVRQQLSARMPEWLGQAAQFQEAQQLDWAKQQTNTSLNSVYNKVRSDPDSYDMALNDGKLVIDAQPKLSDAQRTAMGAAFTQELAKRRFEGLITSATTPEQLDAVDAELRAAPKDGGRDWREEFKPSEYDAALDAVQVRRTAMATRHDTDARAVLSGMKERNAGFSLIPDAELSQARDYVRGAKNATLVADYARIARNQELLRIYGKASPDDIRRKADTVTSATAAYPGLPAELSTYVNKASDATGVSAAYLGATAIREYGGEFSKLNADGSVDYGRSAAGGTSSAIGVFQFVEKTWIGLMRDGVTAKRFGIDIAGKDDAALLALRKNPEVSTFMAAALAEKNKAELEDRLKRPVDDAEVYMAHFLGASGAAKMLTAYTSSPNMLAKDVNPEAAASNKSVFFDKSGMARTVRDVHDTIASKFSTETGRVQFGDSEYLRKLADYAATQLKSDPMTYAANAGTHAVPQIDPKAAPDPAAFAALGTAAKGVAGYFNIPASDMKPLRDEVARGLARRVETGTADETLQVMTALQAMPPEMMRAAYKQIGGKSEDASVFEWAGGLAGDAGRRETADAIIRGRKRMSANPDVKSLTYAETSDIRAEFDKYIGTSMADADPRARQQAYDASVAHYVETVASRGATNFSRDKYNRSIDAVLGGGANDRVVDRVNGAPVVLPRGTSSETVTNALERMSTGDWINWSAQRQEPKYADGTSVPLRVLGDEATLRYKGGGAYNVLIAGGYLTTGRNINGQPEKYVLQLDANRVRDVIGRVSRPEAEPSTGYALQNYDANGNWIGAQ